MTTFESLGLTEPVLKALSAEGYTVPTPIQAKAVPHVLAGRDLFGCAQTGTGKTAAFALPLIERMMANPREREARRCRVLVLAPTRELAQQVARRVVRRTVPLDELGALRTLAAARAAEHEHHGAVRHNHCRLGNLVEHFAGRREHIVRGLGRVDLCDDALAAQNLVKPGTFLY